MAQPKKGRQIARAILLIGAAAISFSAAAQAQAGEASIRRFSIEAGEASSSIQQLARQAGVQVMAPKEDLQGVRTRPVRGDYTVTEALDRMLAGTGLAVVSSGDGAVIVRKRGVEPAPGALPQTDPVQEAPAEPEQPIVVTGSRIQRTGVDTLQAATVVDAEEIEKRGYTNAIQALEDTPGFSPGNSQVGTSQANLGIAQSFSNFFGLGSQRTLTLVNGRRFVSSNTVSGSGGGASPGSQVDVNLIPVGLIQRVETVAIGGAPVYGSDAIAGTVNFILKEDYQGLQISGQASISDRGDAANQSVRALWGANFMEGRGNIVLNAEYTRQEGMKFNERFPNTYTLASSGNTNRTDGIPAQTVIDQRIAVLTEGGLPFRSGTLPADATYIRNAAGQPVQFAPDGTLVPFVLGARYNGDSGGAFRDGGDGLNPVDHVLLLSPNDRILLNALGNFDVTDAINLFFEGSYSKTSGTKLSDLFQLAAPGVGGPSLTMSTSNPFLSQQARDIFAANGVTSFRFNRNLNDIADSRPSKTDLEVYRIVAGVKGDFTVGGQNWYWDASYNYGRSENTSDFNQINQTRFLAAIDVVGTASAPVCRSGGSCVPLNLFGENAFSAAARDYVMDKGVGVSLNELEAISVNLGGRLPFGIAEPISFGIGYEHRSESGSFTGNDIINAGISLLGGGSAYPDAPKRGFNTDEVYGEAIVPLIDDEMGLPLIKGVQAEGALRYVDHSVTGGDVTWSAGGRIEPRIGGLTLRGVYTRAIRSPAIVELFVNTTPTARAANDVCAPSRINAGTNPAARLANCTAALAAVGVTNPATFAPTTNGASPFGFVGGNTALEAEKANSWSLGFVYTPPAIPGLRLSVDYSRVKVAGAITRFTLLTAQAACYDSPAYPNEGACTAFRRLNAAEAAAQTTATGRARVAGDIADGYLESYFNSQKMDFAGVIAELDYRFGVPNIGGGDDRGMIRLGVKAFYTDSYKTQVSGASAVIENSGTAASPRWKLNGRIGYAFDPFDFDLQLIYTSASKLDPVATIEDTPVNDIPAYTLVNTTFATRVTDAFTLQFSVRNLFDKALPYPLIVARNTPSSFDRIGRTYTMRAAIEF